jgi:hypothetical protein
MTRPAPDVVYVPAPDVRYRRVGDEGVVLRQRDAEIMVLNETGVRILSLLDGTRRLADVVDIMTEEYDADRQQIAADVERYIREMDDAGVVAAAEPA